MIAPLAEHSHLPANLDPDYVARHRAWIAAQPGFCGGYHLLEPETGHALSLTMWEDDDVLAAAERALRAGRGPADGRLSRESQPRAPPARAPAFFGPGRPPAAGPLPRVRPPCASQAQAAAACTAAPTPGGHHVVPVSPPHAAPRHRAARA